MTQADEQKFRQIARQMRWFLSALQVVEYAYDEVIPVASPTDIAWMRMMEYYSAPRAWVLRAWDLQRAMRAVFAQMLSELEEDASEEAGTEWLGVPRERLDLLYTACLDLPVQEPAQAERLLRSFIASWEIAWSADLELEREGKGETQ